MRSLWLGTVEYGACWDLQRELAVLRADGEIGDTLLLLEHPPTITLGRGANPLHVLASADALSRRGVTIHETDRGGDVTFHGPGQLVGYPTIDLDERGRDLHKFLRDIESALIDVVSRFGLSARRFPPHTGVWIEDRKIAAIGIKVTRWVSTHGFALNVHSDLSHFELIVPCGIREFGVTSLTAETGRELTVVNVLHQVVEAFEKVFGVACDPSPRLRPLSQSSQRILDQALDVSGIRC